MNRNTWIVILVSVLVGTVILAWQRKGIAELEDEVTLAKNEIESLKAGGGASNLIRKKNPVAPVSKLKSTASGAEPSMVSAHGKLTAREFLQLIPDQEGGPAAMIRMLPALLEKLEPYSAQELFTLVDELNKLPGEKGKAQSITGLLLILLTGVEPEGVLEFAEKQGNASSPGAMQEVLTAAFSTLARKNPQAAREYLENSGWTDRLKQQAELGLIRELARQDFPAALDYLRQSNLDARMMMSTLAVAARDPAVRENMREALSTVDDPAMRNNLATSLVGATFSESGFQGVSALLETMEFPNDEARDQALLGAANSALSTQPAETVEWIQREVSAGRRAEYLANSIRSWADADYNAAGAWLESQEASPEKDAAVSAFANTVVNLDQEAAAVWTGQIQDRAMRITARRRVFSEWHRRNPDAANAWITTRGMNPSSYVLVPGASLAPIPPGE